MGKIRNGVRQILLATARPVFEPEFVIVGTGRSGTGYIARVLTASGVRCGHEGWWNLGHPSVRFLKGDASWMATFRLDGYMGQIFHQIRNPLLAMRSIAAVEVAPHRDTPWYHYRSQFVEFTGDPITDAVLVADRWLSKAEQLSEWTWRLEDVSADLIREIGRRVRRPVTIDPEVFEVERNEKHDLKIQTFDFDWGDLPARPETARVMKVAEQYGYV